MLLGDSKLPRGRHGRRGRLALFQVSLIRNFPLFRTGCPCFEIGTLLKPP